MGCETNECNIQSKIQRKKTNIKTPEVIEYGRLHAEVVIQKLKGEGWKW